MFLKLYLEKMNEKKKCRCFFSELLFDFLQYELFDSYLNYRRYELMVVCKKCFKRVKNRDSVKNQRLREVTMLYEEKLERENLLPLLDNKKYPFSTGNYQEIDQDGVAKWFHEAILKIKNTIELLHFIAQTRCPRFLSFYIKTYDIHRINKGGGFFSSLIYLKDWEMIDCLVQFDPYYPLVFIDNVLHMKNEKIYTDPFQFIPMISKRHKIHKIDELLTFMDELDISTLFADTDNPKIFQLGLDLQLLDFSNIREVIIRDAVHIFKYLLFDKNLQIDQDLINLFIDYKDSQIFKFWFSLENSQQYIKS